MFRKQYCVFVTINNNENDYTLTDVLGTLDYHGIHEHEFYVESVGFEEFVNGVERYRIEVKATKKQIRKIENVLSFKCEEIKVA